MDDRCKLLVDLVQYMELLKRHSPHSQNYVGAASAKASLFAADIESFTLLIASGPHFSRTMI